ncbi:MAG: hypothetical protein H7336_02195 [Bacteriovorax sp.]|nr:hypothetical protein [Bacteriovorax sp.]
MKNLMPFIFAAVLLAGCDKIEGQLNVSKDVKLVTTKGVGRNVRAGTYDADIKANTKKKITLRLNNDGDEKYDFNIPDGSIPSNGSFTYKSSTVGQPVDLKGTVATSSTDGQRQQTTQSCQYQEPVQQCFPLPQGGVNCQIVWQTRFGMQWIQYYDRTTVKDVTLSIAAAGATDESAQFIGHATWADRIVLSQSQCR